MVDIVQLSPSAPVVVEPAVHLERLFSPGNLDPLEMSISFVCHLQQPVPQAVIGATDERDVLAPFRELKNTEYAFRHLLNIFSEEWGPWGHGP